MFRFLWRIARAALALHLILPMAASIVIGSLVAAYTGKASTYPELLDYWLAHSAELLTVYLVFIAVLIHLARQETEIRIPNLPVLDGVLQSATEYFALASIPIREWFDPPSQLYLSRLFARQMKSGMRQDRILVFPTRAGYQDVDNALLDEYHGRCLNRIHREFGSRLGFIPPSTLFKMLDSLSEEHKKAFGYSRMKGWCRRRGLPVWGMARLQRRLAFAEIRDAGGAVRIVQFSKRSGHLKIGLIEQPSKIAPFVALSETIRRHIYESGQADLKPEFDFNRHIEL